jgi:anti-sigma regulatory factor (Ser/Thr protein kinase)
MSNKKIPAKFKPRARLLLQLGDQLIKNESIALVELVKNSYDADAREVSIIMENPGSDEGVLIIEDDGYGMSTDIVINVWLEPGSDYKTKKIKNLEYSPKFHRLPIGEKGIGRFGVHKLGNIIEMTTKAKDSKEVYVKIDWRDFNDYDYLDQVPIEVIERDSPEYFKEDQTGTNILIKDLREDWTRGTARKVKRSITALVSPFETNDSFKPTFDIYGKEEWFEGLLEWDEIKDYALYHFKALISGDSIKEFEYQFMPWKSMPKVSDRTVTKDEKLVNMFSKLEDRESKDNNQFSLFDDGLEIGEIKFEGYIFDMDKYILKLGVNDQAGFKKYLKENGGVKVFRDKLRIYDYGEPENDWLELDHRRFQNPFKAFSNNQILGAVYLDRKTSKSLVEKTNREGFVENEAYYKFKKAVENVVYLVETLREPDKRRLKNIYGPTPKSEPVMSLLNEAKDYVEKKVEPSTVKNQVSKYLVKIEDDYKRVNENLLKAAGAGLSMSVVIHEVEKIISEVLHVLKNEDASERLLNLVKHLSSLIDGYAEIVRRSKKSNENIIEVIDQAIFNTEYRLGAHNVEVIRKYKKFDGDKKVKLSKSLVIGSLMNLVDNSIYWLNKANKSNLELNQKILIDLQEDENYLYLVFSDNGTGFMIPTDDVTEPFVSAKPDGIGLGLHITNEIMEAQDGRIIFPDYGDFELPDEFKDGATIVLAFNK